MGDQVGVALSGKLYYILRNEFDRVRALQVRHVKKTALFAVPCEKLDGEAIAAAILREVS